MSLDVSSTFACGLEILDDFDGTMHELIHWLELSGQYTR
jgi:hypothetical protein